MQKNSSALNVRSLIILGISFILYIFIFVLVVHTLAFFIPFIFPLFPAILAFLGGFVFLLLVTKAPGFGIVTLFSILLTVFIMIFGHGIYTLSGIFLGIAADLVLRRGHYQSWRYLVAAYMIFALWTLTALLPLYISFDSFQKNTVFSDTAATFIKLLRHALEKWNFGLVAALTLAGAYLGMYWGRSVLRKIAAL